MAAKFLPYEANLRLQGFKLIAGIDEAGRGPLAGPVVSAAVILKDKAKLPGLDDSKKLTAKKREYLFEQILDNVVDYAIAVVPAEIIDKYNILNATLMANDLCVQTLAVKPDFILIDGRDKQILDLPFMTVIKGDSLIESVAAASILAKVTRDAIMRHYAKEFPLFGFDMHMGYGTRVHVSNIREHGYCEIHRKSFLLKAEQLELFENF
ncbi:MAG: ribonuclease HII [Patescibacteria group bacterium]